METTMVVIRKDNSLWTSEDILVAQGDSWLVEIERANQLVVELEADGTRQDMAADGINPQLVIFGEKSHQKASASTVWNFLNGVLEINPRPARD